MFERVLKGRFYSKCKSYVKKTMKRIEMIRIKRKAVQKFMENDIIQLLRNGLNTNAYGKTGGLMEEMRRSDCYELVHHLCAHVLTHLEAMRKQKDGCPEDCKEAVSSLMYAAARFGDLPELRDLRTLFSKRYGSSVDASFVSQKLKKLISEAPSEEHQLKFMQELAEGCDSHDEKSTISEEETMKNPAQDELVLETEEKPNLDDEQRAPEEEEARSSKMKLKFIPPPYVIPNTASPTSVNKTGNDLYKEALQNHSTRRASSLPKETSLNPGIRRHGRAATFPPERRSAHVHPKLPEYDDFVAQLQTFRSLHRNQGS